MRPAPPPLVAAFTSTDPAACAEELAAAGRAPATALALFCALLGVAAAPEPAPAATAAAATAATAAAASLSAGAADTADATLEALAPCDEGGGGGATCAVDVLSALPPRLAPAWPDLPPTPLGGSSICTDLPARLAQLERSLAQLRAASSRDLSGSGPAAAGEASEPSVASTLVPPFWHGAGGAGVWGGGGAADAASGGDGGVDDGGGGEDGGGGGGGGGWGGHAALLPLAAEALDAEVGRL